MNGHQIRTEDLYMTTDGGRTWTLTLQKDELTGVIDVDMDPTDPNILYAINMAKN